jgi:hypothetical protein
MQKTVQKPEFGKLVKETVKTIITIWKEYCAKRLNNGTKIAIGNTNNKYIKRLFEY